MVSKCSERFRHLAFFKYRLHMVNAALLSDQTGLNLTTLDTKLLGIVPRTAGDKLHRRNPDLNYKFTSGLDRTHLGEVYPT